MTKPAQPYFISSTQPVKKIISNVSFYLSLKTPDHLHSSTFLNSSHPLATGARAGMTNVPDSGFSRVTEAFREKIRVNRPLQEQECADNTGRVCSANVLCRKPYNL